jgi:ubiquinone/menaquinone biosynthesis C-methylase UbiE
MRAGARWRDVLHRGYSFLERVITPSLRNAQFEYLETLRQYADGKTRWLEAGCGRELIPGWMAGAEAGAQELMAGRAVAVGVDVDEGSVRANRALRLKAVARVENLPFADRSFTLVSANMVVEHLADPSGFLEEAHRVLQQGGTLVFHTPNRLSYRALAARVLPQRIKAWVAKILHERPSDEVYLSFYRMNTPAAIHATAERLGFVVRELRLVETTAETATLGPLALPELIAIQLLRFEPLKGFRANLIGVLVKR